MNPVLWQFQLHFFVKRKHVAFRRSNLCSEQTFREKSFRSRQEFIGSQCHQAHHIRLRYHPLTTTQQSNFALYPALRCRCHETATDEKKETSTQKAPSKRNHLYENEIKILFSPCHVFLFDKFIVSQFHLNTKRAWRESFPCTPLEASLAKHRMQHWCCVNRFPLESWWENSW